MMKKLSSQDEAAMLKNLIFVSLISADNDKYEEDIKQEIIQRHQLACAGFNDPTNSEIDWDYVFAPLGRDSEKYTKLMKA